MFQMAAPHFLVLSALPLLCWACQPQPPQPGDNSEIGPYDLVNAPTFHANFSPPLGWTYSTVPATGQASSATEAQQKMQSDLTSALKSESTFGVPADISFNSDFTDPINITAILTSGSELQPGQGRVQLGAVVSICEVANGTTCVEQTLIQPARVTLRNGPLLNGLQWKNVANRLLATLQLNAGVVFRDMITVTK